MSREAELARWHEVGDEGQKKEMEKRKNALHDFKDQEHLWASVLEVWVADQPCCVNRIQ